MGENGGTAMNADAWRHSSQTGCFKCSSQKHKLRACPEKHNKRQSVKLHILLLVSVSGAAREMSIQTREQQPYRILLSIARGTNAIVSRKRITSLKIPILHFGEQERLRCGIITACRLIGVELRD
ncbi:hypothetical protein E1301_Tti020289 [Triplophysa tibetana]|uniref:CCHC-type domain-containing protein n=1 Tax=Triplophysa tibetana TaxID=1572043 RepID=A0A5A9NLX2_9TELE|nr:hypothetical protein E1301_Tti020289 [Triplophysa tibetana]